MRVTRDRETRRLLIFWYGVWEEATLEQSGRLSIGASKYLDIMLFIFESGAALSKSTSSDVPKRAFSLSTLLCSLSISTLYWKLNRPRPGLVTTVKQHIQRFRY